MLKKNIFNINMLTFNIKRKKPLKRAAFCHTKTNYMKTNP